MEYSKIQAILLFSPAMFLFFSKLLPLFVYPLGLACLLLIVALFTVWKQPRWTAVLIGLAFVLLGLGGNGAIASELVYSLEKQYIPPAALPQADAIVVLGGGIRSQSPPRPWIDVSEAGDRTIHGAQLYNQGKAPLVILSGGRIDWQGGGPPESGDMAKLVEALGVPATAIVQDPTSLNTYENAVNVKQILDQRGLKKILLVTSAMHMPRAVQIFQKLGISTVPAPTDFLISEQERSEPVNTVQGKLLATLPEAENLYRFTRALKEYIGIGVYRLRGWL